MHKNPTTPWHRLARTALRHRPGGSPVAQASPLVQTLVQTLVETAALVKTPALVLVLAAGACSPTAPESRATLSGTRPNILFLFSDDHGAQAISAYGSRINQTPNIDRIAEQGLLFRNVFCGNSICGPSRAAILSGQHAHANGFMRNGNKFDPEHQTFPKLLRQSGYTTAMIGKWHLTSDPTGFDHWMVLPGQGSYYNPDFLTPLGKRRIDGYVTDVTTDLALDWLEKGRDKDKPFLLMCQHKAPHRSWMPGPEELDLYRDVSIPEPATLFDDYSERGPALARQQMEIDRHMSLFYDLKLVPDEEQGKRLKGINRWWESPLERMTPQQRQVWDAAYASDNAAFRKARKQGNLPAGSKALLRWKYQRYIKNYLRCVAGVDKSVGRILDWLDEHPKIKANTLVIYSSDQGFYLGEHGWFDKRWMFEESLRMPFVLSWPGRIAGGKERQQLAQNIDFGPTFLDLAGIRIPDQMQGISLVPLLEGRAPGSWRDAIYYHYYESHAVHMVPAHYGVRTQRYKLIHYYEPENQYWELYDLEQDPQEMTSLAGNPAYADIETRLRQRLTELRQQYADDTGDLGNGAFPIMAGIASVKTLPEGWLVRANAWGGYLLQPLTSPITAQATLRCRIQSPREQASGHQAKREGYVLIAGNRPRQDLLRVGIDFAKREILIYGPNLRKPLARAPLDIDPTDEITLTLHIDMARHQLRATAKDQSITASLPPRWKSIRYTGYGASDTTTRFSRIQRQPLER